MRYCQRCGVPRILTSEHKWAPNGTISLVRDARHRMVFIDNNALNHVLDSIAEQIGIPLEAIILEAKRKSSKDFMGAVLSGLKGVLARNLISARVYGQLAKQVSMLGLGHAEVTSYKRHAFLEGVIENAYSAPAITGDICGAFESVEGCPADARYEIEGDGLVKCTIQKSTVMRPEFADRFTYVPPPTLPGRNIYELCPVCKAPLVLGKQYEFQAERGIILDRKTGHRVVLIGVMTLTNLFGELEKELGDGVPRMIADIEKERIKSVILSKDGDRDTGEAGYLKYMKTLELKGMGNGKSVALSNGRVDVRIENPYYEPLVAGFLAGFYEATSGNAASYQWTEADSGYTDITVQGA
ncbi:MAG: hypothetical protein ACYC99_01435 [Candidatus Geothermincolia bacterium]